MVKDYVVTLRFQSPAWDEVDGIKYYVSADNKRDANSNARRQADRDGHLGTGKGRYWFTAEEEQGD